MTKAKKRILVVDDDPDVLLAAQFLLKQSGADVQTAKDPMVLPSLLERETYDIILLDMNFGTDVSSGKEGFRWLRKILEMDPAAVVVLITAYGDVEMAVKAIKEGAVDFVLKPWQNEKLLATVSAAMSLKESKRQVEQLRNRQEHLSSDLAKDFSGIVGESPALHQLFEKIKKVAATDANVLILGENGTGKELVARELHRQSNRRNEVFIAVDMGAVHGGLFESELFGHVKGAFTDARDDRAGRFEVASGGTLFLDEIGNLPLAFQAKLLTVLQNREVTRVGSNRAIPIDIRLICASNHPLDELVMRKEFRDDLFYRIHTVELRIPPLRERLEDLQPLVAHFLAQYCARYQKPIMTVDPATIKKLQQYPWPGNVRELQHAVERAVIMSDAPVLQSSDFLLSEAKEETPGETRLNLDEIEKTAIQRALVRNDGNITHAAKELGLTRTALYRRLEKYGL